MVPFVSYRQLARHDEQIERRSYEVPTARFLEAEEPSDGSDNARRNPRAPLKLTAEIAALSDSMSAPGAPVPYRG